MKKEIKFRVWATDMGVMSYDFGVGDEYIIFPNNEGRMTYSETLEIMQFTGLKDKNGKDIYEGDIVNGAYETDSDFNATKSELRIVEFGNYSFRLSTASGETKNRLSEYFYFEVIGNIYENPELLSHE